MSAAKSDLPNFKIQVRDSAGTILPQGVVEDFVDALPEHFTRLGAVVDEVGRTFLARIEQMAKKPSSVGLEFGVDVGGEVGVPFITKGTMGANFKISVTWEQ